ncbi:MAG TPA: hypothetical protein VGG39_07125 [Polyangiaceae bacterium]|jgi:hypothetical protein
MRLRDRSVRAALAGLAIAVGACAGASTSGKPVAALASSPGAATDFEAIREAWKAPSRGSPAVLRAALEQFLAQYPHDGLVPLAHVYLALLALDAGDAAAADHEIALGQSLPPGSTRDLWTVAVARRMRGRGNPDGALDTLRPLVGKNVDPVVRREFEEELTRTALATGRDYEAISYMDAWLRGSTEEEKDASLAEVTKLVEQLPREVLVGSLEAMRSQRASLGYGIEIERILAARLVQLATTTGDAELARLLLDPDAGALVVAGDAGLALGELATSRRGLNVVEGRTVGLLLPTESPGLRDESADVLRGVMWALGLPRGVRTAASGGADGSDGGAAGPGGGPGGATGVTRAGAGGPGPSRATPARASTRPQCAPLEAAPPLDEPAAAEQVRLVTRDDAGSADRTEVSLDELAGEGASVIVAALDAQTATRALRWSEGHAVPVVALVPPSEAVASHAFGFVLGESRAVVVDALGRAAPALQTDAVVPVVDESEVGTLPAQGGLVNGLSLLPPTSCDVVPSRAGDPRFPLAAWARTKAHAWLVSGSPACARDVVGELSSSHARGLVALTLEAAALPPHDGALRVVSASAGVVPESAADDARDEELRRFAATLGTVSWWTALGRDAATLARLAVRPLPADAASDPKEVADRRARARTLLAAARARLWTTESTGWTPEHAVKRTICAVDAPAR